MGKTISTLFTTECYQCQGTGADPKNQFRVCHICHGEKYISIFCIKNEEPPYHRYDTTGFEIR